MPQPTPYDRLTNFQNDQALAPVDPYPAPKIDQEYNAIKITIDEILQNLALIQRDDGQLANGSVGWDQLKDEVLVGFGPPEPWETAHLYRVGNTVFEDDGFYLCIVEHTSGVFADDLAAGKWSLIVDFAAHTAAAEAAAAAAEAAAAEAAESALDASAAQGAFRWNFDSSTAMSDPGVGDVRGNGTPASAVTMIAISGQTADLGNPNILPWILTWDDSTSPVRGTIFIRKVADPEIFAVFNVTGPVFNNSTWVQISVSYVIHSGTLVNGEPVSVAFMRTGNQGVNGPGTGDMIGANNLTDVANAATSLANLGGLAKAGDTMTGDLTIAKEFPGIVLNSTTGTHSTITHQDNGVIHWQFGEADLGNHLFFDRHDAAGVFQETSFYIAHNTGDAYFAKNVSVGINPTAPMHAATKQYVDAISSRRNRIINGAMQIAQEFGAGGCAASAAGAYAVDQWAVAASGLSGVTAARAGGGPYFLSVNISVTKPALAINDYVLVTQGIEGINVADFAFGTATAKQLILRFSVRMPLAGTYSVAIRNGANNRSWVGTYTIAAPEAAIWVTRTLVIPGDVTGTWAKDTTAGLYVTFGIAVGTAYHGVLGWQAGAMLAIAGVANPASLLGAIQFADVSLYLDDGTGVAPKWEMPDEAAELIRCQRYFEVGFSGLSNAAYSVASTIAGTVSYKVMKRVTPTITYFGTSLTNLSSIFVALNNTMGLYTGGNVVTVGSTADFYTNFTANARIP